MGGKDCQLLNSIAPDLLLEIVRKCKNMPQINGRNIVGQCVCAFLTRSDRGHTPPSLNI